MRDAANPLPMVTTAMILAAGRGQRMRPLTDAHPKPLLHVHGKPLIEWHLEALARDGVRHIVINTAWLEAQIPAALGDGSRWGVSIRYSMEGRDHGGALETAGGMAKARPWLQNADTSVPATAGADCFWLVSADIYAPDFRFDPQAAAAFAASDDLAHLWLVPNPDFHAQGDFALGADGRARRTAEPALQRLTYSNLALCRAALVDAVVPGTHAALGPLLFKAADAGRVGASRWTGRWENVGTPAQLEALNQQSLHQQ